MKKKGIVVLAALCFALAGALSSCEKSNEAMIKEVLETQKEGLKAIKNGDHDKAMKLLNKSNELIEELGKRDLTDEEKQELGQIATKQFVDQVNEEWGKRWLELIPSKIQYSIGAAQNNKFDAAP